MNSSGSMGSAMYASAPRSRPWARSATAMACAEIWMTGIAVVTGSSLMRSHTSYP